MAKGKGMTFKVQAYKQSFENLIKTVETLREEYTDRDRKRDMTALLRKATYVYGFVKRHLWTGLESDHGQEGCLDSKDDMQILAKNKQN